MSSELVSGLSLIDYFVECDGHLAEYEPMLKLASTIRGQPMRLAGILSNVNNDLDEVENLLKSLRTLRGQPEILTRRGEQVLSSLEATHARLREIAGALSRQAITEWNAAVERDVATLAGTLVEARITDRAVFGLGPSAVAWYGERVTMLFDRLKSAGCDVNLTLVLIGMGAAERYAGRAGVLVAAETPEEAAAALAAYTREGLQLQYAATDEEQQEMAAAIQQRGAPVSVTGLTLGDFVLLLRQMLQFLAGLDPALSAQSSGELFSGINLNQLAEHLKALAELGV